MVYRIGLGCGDWSRDSLFLETVNFPIIIVSLLIKWRNIEQRGGKTALIYLIHLNYFTDRI